MVSLAGAVAEILDSPQGKNSGDALLGPIMARVSAADRRGAGNFSRADVDRCLRLVVALWPSIEARARHEIDIFLMSAHGNAFA